MASLVLIECQEVDLDLFILKILDMLHGRLRSNQMCIFLTKTKRLFFFVILVYTRLKLYCCGHLVGGDLELCGQR
jgi:hypothetical protein